TGYWGYQLNTEKKQLIADKTQLSSEIGEMNVLKSELETEVDSLQTAYEMLAEENESLQTSLTEEKKRVRRRDATIKSVKASLNTAKSESDAQLGSLRTEIQSLLASKAQLENSILSLKTENDSLRALTGVLTQDLGKAREDNLALANLNRAMEGELDRLTLANFKASAFRVEVQKRNKKKVTSKSRRARRINVSFDLTEVPEGYQGVRPVYLVIADEKATPIKLKEPIQASVTVNGQVTDIIAAEAKEVNVVKNQRISFSHELDSKLKSGYYRISVYTDIGLLGATSLRLR
ncbi:MAG: hypothetical protein AAGD05_05340, partial [Bacteroidota bacterium]